MKVLDIYIARAILLYTLIVLLVLLGIYTFTTLVAEMSVVGQGSYTTLDAMRYSLMLIPRQIYEIFPMVALLGTMLGLGSLTNSSELTVMRTAGMSVQHIALAVIKPGLLMVIVVALLSEFVAPSMEKQAHFQRMQAIDRTISFATDSGLWIRDGDTFLSIKMLFPDGEASGLTRYLMDGQRLQAIVTAQRGQYLDDAWHVEQVQTTRFAEERVEVFQHDHQRWISSLTPDVISTVALPAENLSVFDLAGFVSYLQENGLASQQYEMAMWMRVFAPLATGGMILLALPFVFGSSRTLGMDRRILLGVLLGISFYLFNGIFSRIGLLYELSPLVTAMTPTLTVYALWFYLMRRVN